MIIGKVEIFNREEAYDGKENGCFKIDEAENREMFLVQCVLCIDTNNTVQ